MAKRVLVAVTGGIAAHKAADVVSELMYRGVDVGVIMTKNACEFITPLTFEALTGEKVYTDTFDYSVDATIKHVVLGQTADAFVVVPATADAIAKIACGIADDMVSSTALAATCPLVVCPAMNVHMYENPATQENVRVLASRGIVVVDPVEGRLACGEAAKGRLAPVEDIVDAVMRVLDK